MDSCRIVESVGEGVTSVKPGDHVIPCYQVSQGTALPGESGPQGVPMTLQHIMGACRALPGESGPQRAPDPAPRTGCVSWDLHSPCFFWTPPSPLRLDPA